MRIPVAGQTDEALTIAATDARELISGLDPDGDSKVFVLEEIELTNEHVSQDAVIEFWDQDEAVAVAANQRGAITVPAASTVTKGWPAGTGPRFKTNFCGSATQGTFAIGTQRASGYLE